MRIRRRLEPCQAGGVTDQPVEQKERTLVGVSFADAFRAQEFLTAATRLAANQRLRLLDAVFVRKDASGRTTVRERSTRLPVAQRSLARCGLGCSV